MAYAIMCGISFGLLREHDGRGILHKIDRANIAFAAVRLLVVARWTLE